MQRNLSINYWYKLLPLGLILAGYLHLNLVDGVLYGSIAGFLIGFLFGVDAIERLMSWWP